MTAMDIASFNDHSDVGEVLQVNAQQEPQSSKHKAGYAATPVDTSATGDTVTPGGTTQLENLSPEDTLPADQFEVGLFCIRISN